MFPIFFAIRIIANFRIGSAQEEIEDNVAIEYVEDGGTSSDILIEEYGEAGKFDTEENSRSHVKTLPVSQAQTIIYSTNNSGKKDRILRIEEKLV